MDIIAVKNRRLLGEAGLGAVEQIEACIKTAVVNLYDGTPGSLVEALKVLGEFYTLEQIISRLELPTSLGTVNLLVRDLKTFDQLSERTRGKIKEAFDRWVAGA